MPPEYGQYGDVSPKVDVYAFGVVLYELILAKEAIVKANGSVAESKGLVAMVAERALFLWNNDHIRNLITQNRKVILPIILPALEKNTRGHWNQAAQSLTLNVRKVFIDADQSFFDECLIKYQEDELKEKEKHKKRESLWIRLESVAASKSNEPKLVSKFASAAISN